MTTAAYDRASGILACDTQVTSGNRKFRTRKVHRLPCGGLIAGTGNLVHILKVARWVQSGYADKDRPEFGDDERGEFECLIVQGNGDVFLLDDDLEPMQITDEYCAVGSGGPYAVAAIACGKSAADAVRVAAMFDAATSEPVEVYRLEAPKAKRKRKK